MKDKSNTPSIVLRHFLPAAIIMVSLTIRSEPDIQKPKNPASKSQGLTSDIYEKEDPVSTFSASVTMIRETDVIEVFFEGKNKGPYLLKDDPNLGSFKERLAKSQKNKNQTVTVKIVDDVITDVVLSQAKEIEKKKSDLDSVLDDMFKK